MDKKFNFVITQDEEFADQMISHGMRLVQHVADTYVFLNDPQKMNFAEGIKGKYTYSNRMMF